MSVDADAATQASGCNSNVVAQSDPLTEAQQRLVDARAADARARRPRQPDSPTDGGDQNAEKRHKATDLPAAGANAANQVPPGNEQR